MLEKPGASRIMIADDHIIVRKGIKEILSGIPDLEVCCEARNYEEVLSFAKKEKPDIIVLDINMPGRSGLEALADLKLLFPEIPVMILSINPEEQFARRSIKAGASGYMNKDIEPEEFIMALRKILRGGIYIGPDFAEKLFWESELQRKETYPHDQLSDREFEVFRMLVNGQSVSEISHIMSLSIKTISTYKTRILQKMNMRDIAELKNYALKYDLIK